MKVQPKVTINAESLGQFENKIKELNQVVQGLVARLAASELHTLNGHGRAFNHKAIKTHTKLNGARSLEAMRSDIASYRKRLRAAKADPQNRGFSLVVKDSRGKKIRALRELTWHEAFKQRRDWYKILVTTMGQQIKLSVTFEEREAS